jgi:hypothetical protein
MRLPVATDGTNNQTLTFEKLSARPTGVTRRRSHARPRYAVNVPRLPTVRKQDAISDAFKRLVGDSRFGTHVQA